MSLSDAARRLMAAHTLDFAEKYELHRLRQCKLQVPATSSEREELSALRAELRRELEEVRALTQDSQLSYAADPVEELYWRRKLAEDKREAAEAAREEKDRKKREADEERLTYLHQKHKTDQAQLKREADEEEKNARLKREADEERRAGYKSKKEHEARQADEQRKLTAWQATQHDVLSPHETEVYARILRDPLYGDDGKTPPGDDPPAAEMRHHHVDWACGKMHWSLMREVACSLVRREEAVRAEASRPKPAAPSPPVARAPTPRLVTLDAWPVPSPDVSRVTHPAPKARHQPASPAPPPPPRPATTSSSPKPPAPPPSSPSGYAYPGPDTRIPTPARDTRIPTQRPTTPASSAPTRPVQARPGATSTDVPHVTQTPPQGRHQPAPPPPPPRPATTPTSSSPSAPTPHLHLVPAPRPTTSSSEVHATVAPALRGRILDACSTQDLRSYRDILGVVKGSRRSAIQDAIREMDGPDIALVNGVYRPVRGR